MRITTINSIETSSKCNLACQYCMAKDQHKYRAVGIMSLETFKRALEWVRYYSNKGTQKELNLFGVGEPLLNSNIVEMVRLAREVVPVRYRVHMNSNGIKLTEELAFALKSAGLNSMDLTAHDAYHTAKSIRIVQKAGLAGQVSLDFVIQPNDWAGQVNWFKSVVRYPCPWLHVGQCFILSNGAIAQCCFDAKAQSIMGNVNDIPGELEAMPFKLCETCHQDMPREI